MAHLLEKILEGLIFKSRWLMAPMYLGIDLHLHVGGSSPSALHRFA